MTEEEMIIIQKYYHHLSQLAKKDRTIRTSHSIAEANELHNRKKEKNTKPDNIKKTTKNTSKKITKK
ncbi:hypothetical protein BB050_03168 [Flavobacterium anhuiense]|nr:hypothetical protein BB050_03168 [Flavobacterium anhuiense]